MLSLRQCFDLLSLSTSYLAFKDSGGKRRGKGTRMQAGATCHGTHSPSSYTVVQKVDDLTTSNKMTVPLLLHWKPSKILEDFYVDCNRLCARLWPAGCSWNLGIRVLCSPEPPIPPLHPLLCPPTSLLRSAYRCTIHSFTGFHIAQVWSFFAPEFNILSETWMKLLMKFISNAFWWSHFLLNC